MTRRALPEQVSLVNKVVYNHSQHSPWRSPTRQMSSRTITFRLGERQCWWPPALPSPPALVREALTPEQEWLRLLAPLGRLDLRQRRCGNRLRVLAITAIGQNLRRLGRHLRRRLLTVLPHVLHLLRSCYDTHHQLVRVHERSRESACDNEMTVARLVGSCFAHILIKRCGFGTSDR